MTMSDEQEKLTSQWITSLAISVVCCAALFLVFAGYVMDLHEKSSLTAIRLEVLQERQRQIIAELDAIRRPIPVVTTGVAGQPPVVIQSSEPAIAPGVVPPSPGEPASSMVPHAPVAPAPVPPAATAPSAARPLPVPTLVPPAPKK